MEKPNHMNPLPGTHDHRIHAADFIKGVCIILVILDHAQFINPASCKIHQMLDQIEVAGFFFISGFLYRDSGSFKEWLTKKAKRLVIPFIFFGMLYAVADFLLDPSGFVQGWKSYLLYLYPAPINAPMWFVRALFWMLLFQRAARHMPKWAGYCIVAGIMVGTGLTNAGSCFPIHGTKLNVLLACSGIPCSMTSYPFFWFGNLLARNKDFAFNLPRRVKLPLAFLLLFCWYLSARPGVHLHVPSAESWPLLYLSATSGTLAILLFMEKRPEVPIINYLGKNSLIILGTHMIVINIFHHIGIQSPLTVALCTIIIMPLIIYPLHRYLPGAVGDK